MRSASRIRRLARVPLAALVAASIGVAALADVRFLAPRARSTALGPTEVRLEVDPPRGAEVVRVEVSVDGTPLSTLTAPPWTLTWDAGDGSRGHTLSAVATFTDGTTERAAVSTSRLRINAVEEVDLVNLYAVVRDERGRYVEGLTRDDFRLLEDGREQTIKVFTAEPKPLVVSIVLDASTTMEGKKIETARESAVGFLRALSERDRALVVGFADSVRVVQGLTDDREALRSAVESVRARGGTALYDAVWSGADLLCREDARKVMVVLSDGRDEAANGLEPGSLHTMQEALDHALRCETMIFAIGLGSASDLRQLDFLGRRSQADVLRSFAEATGGAALFPRRSNALRRAFEDVADDLRNQYAVAYSSDNDVLDGAWREIRLLPKREGLQVVTRSGYYANPPED